MIAIDIIGCGEVALQFHAPVLRHLGRLGLVGVRGCYDRDERRARRLCRLLGGDTWGVAPPGEPAPSVRAVLVATPPQSHAEVSLPYLRAGRHALIEKPFVGKREDADAMVAEARRAGSRILVGHMRRFYPAVRIAREFALAGGLGTLLRATATEGGRWGGWAVVSNYIVDDPFGGVLFDTGSHVLDTLLFILGADQDPSTEIEIIEVARDRAGEPSQDFRADFTVTREGLGRIPVRLAVSRTQALAAGIRLEGQGGTLFVPSSPTPSPRLFVGGRTFALGHSVCKPLAVDALGSLTLEHLALVSVVQAPATDTVLDAKRFLTLALLLEQLAKGGRP